LLYILAQKNPITTQNHPLPGIGSTEKVAKQIVKKQHITAQLKKKRHFFAIKFPQKSH
jgi:hypothetical protein